MRSIIVPAEIILTFPPQTKITDEVAQAAIFACEQHLNSIGMINYKGPMIQVGTLDFGLRVHMHPEPMRELKAEIGERTHPMDKVVEMIRGDRPDAKDVPSVGGVDYDEPDEKA